jgi:hypothetical protein
VGVATREERGRYLFGGCVVGRVEGGCGELVEGVVSVEEGDEAGHAHGTGGVALPRDRLGDGLEGARCSQRLVDLLLPLGQLVELLAVPHRRDEHQARALVQVAQVGVEVAAHHRYAPTHPRRYAK